MNSPSNFEFYYNVPAVIRERGIHYWVNLFSGLWPENLDKKMKGVQYVFVVFERYFSPSPGLIFFRH